LPLVPARYSDCVVTKFVWVEFWLLPSFLYRSGATPKERAESWSIIETLVPQIAPFVAYNFGARNHARARETAVRVKSFKM
jgi:hypothetical protein